MILSLLAALTLSAASPTPVPVADPSPYFLDNATVVQVICATVIDGEEGSYRGSAFYIGDGRFVTARHVVRDEENPNKPLFGTCTVNGMPITVLDVGKGSVDYAMFTVPVYPPYRAVLSCRGFQSGQTYYASGFAAGRPWIATQRLTGTGSRSYEPGPGNNEDLLRGAVTAGMSGGPVVDQDGLVVGIVSAGAEYGETISMFLSLADTPLCRK